MQSRTEQPANLTTSYSYATANDVQRLIGATVKNGSGATVESWAYEFDAAGNRTKRTLTAGTTTTTTGYGYNQANQLCWTVNAAPTGTCATPPTGASSYAYDANGNQTTGSLGYDALSRATSMAGSTLGYLTPGNQELVAYGTTNYQNNLLGLSRQIPSSGSAVSYVRQPDGTPVAQRTSTTKQHLFGDRLGSPTAVADTNTNSLTRSYAYDPDGQRTTATTGTGSGAGTDLALAGGHTLPNGLIHFSARYYNPGTARWTQPDPLRQVASLQQANRYGYVGGDPINRTDVGGLAYDYCGNGVGNDSGTEAGARSCQNTLNDRRSGGQAKDYLTVVCGYAGVREFAARFITKVTPVSAPLAATCAAYGAYELIRVIR